jgi:hypothetical protein
MSTKGNTVAINSFLSGFLSSLEPRNREVIQGRFGLNGDEPITLQAIGDRYSITRERVRQIEAATLTMLRKNVNHPYIAGFLKAAMQDLKEAGGAMREDQFLARLQRLMGDKSPNVVFGNGAKFILELSGKVANFRDNYSDWHTFWYLGETDKKRAESFAEKFAASLAAKREEVGEGRNFDDIFRSAAASAKLAPEVARTYLVISKKFGESPFGDFGLVSWPEINPRTARDWAYLILKREKKPLHFTELASMVGRHRKGKRTNMQTIHNELIKGEHFVLVGRGLYALREHGFIPGTAREIITHVLRKHGPLRPQEVVSKVSDQRFLKEGTILINLQNRKHFTSLPDGRYAVKEA